MNCAEAEILIHALLDGELDTSQAREVEAHLDNCPDCAGKLAAFRNMRQVITDADLTEKAPSALRDRIEASLAASSALTALPRLPAQRYGQAWQSRRSFAGGLVTGAIFSTAIAATLTVGVLRGDQDQLIAAEIVSAHLRSLQPGHLTDVQTSDQHTVKPWFNGKLDVAPPVIDLTAQGFTLIGGRLDDINDQAVAAIVYRRRNHVINLFVMRQPDAQRRAVQSKSQHGFNVRYWAQDGLGFWAVSDLNGAELDEFYQVFDTAMH
jgi:mycothiol system anti-sigma-R factor